MSMRKLVCTCVYMIFSHAYLKLLNHFFKIRNPLPNSLNLRDVIYQKRVWHMLVLEMQLGRRVMMNFASYWLTIWCLNQVSRTGIGNYISHTCILRGVITYPGLRYLLLVVLKYEQHFNVCRLLWLWYQISVDLSDLIWCTATQQSYVAV